MTPKELFDSNTRLVYYLIRQFKIPQNHYDDAVQEAMLGLWEACVGFNPELGYEFSTYAVPLIRGRIQRYRRDKISLIRIPRRCYESGEPIDLVIFSLDDQITDSSDSTFWDLAPGIDDFYPTLFEDQIEEFLETKRGIKHYFVYEELLYGCAYGDEPNQVEIAEKYNISQAQVSRIFRRCRKEFRIFLNQIDYSQDSAKEVTK